jgi:peroxiredoxin
MKKTFVIAVLSFVSLFSLAQNIPEQPTDISPLLIGEKVPDVWLPDASGKQISLADLVSQKPTVLIFYRGGWCPYCNLHLAELQSIEAEVLTAGFQIVAISPDSPENLQASVGKNKLNYRLLSDSDTKASQGFGLAFRAPERYQERLSKSSDNKNSGILPVPAVFVLNPQGEILFEYINPDYKKRLKGSLLLAVLNAVKE